MFMKRRTNWQRQRSVTVNWNLNLTVAPDYPTGYSWCVRLRPRINDISTCLKYNGYGEKSQWGRMIRRLSQSTVGLSDAYWLFPEKLVTAIRWSLAYIRGCLGSIELPFEPLNTWGHPCAERRHPNTWDQPFPSRIQSLEECKCARA